MEQDWVKNLPALVQSHEDDNDNNLFTLNYISIPDLEKQLRYKYVCKVLLGCYQKKVSNRINLYK